MAAFTKTLPLFFLTGISSALRMPVETNFVRDATATLDIPRSEPTKLQIPNASSDAAEDLNGELRVRAVSPTLAEVSGATYIGCFQNGSNDILTVTRITDFGLTPELCRNMCKLKSVGYFAMERGYYCYCGQQIEAFAVSAPESECSSACDGGTTALCGGVQRVNVYSITNSAATDAVPAATKTLEITTTDAAGSTVVETSTVVESSSGTTDENNSNGASTNNSSGNSSSDSTAPIGAIIGGAIGGVALIAIIAGGMMYFCFRRMRQEVAEARAEVFAAKANHQTMPPNITTGQRSPDYGFVGAKPERNVYATPTTPGTDVYQQTPPPQPSVSPMGQPNGYAAPPPASPAQASQLPAEGAPPPHIQASDPRQTQTEGAPQELNDTSQRVYEMGNFYKR